MQILKYGIEGLIVPDGHAAKVKQGYFTCDSITTDTQKETAVFKIADHQKKKQSEVSIQLFDRIQIEIVAEMIEFRRSINIHFRCKGIQKE